MKKGKQALEAVTKARWKPSETHRELVRVHVLNGIPEHRIAASFGVSVDELRYHFSKELNFSREEVLAMAAHNMIRLANRDDDPATAFRANALLLQSRLKTWRVPTGDAPDATEQEALKAVGKMSLEEMDAEIGRILARRAGRGEAAAAPADPHAQDEGADEP